MKSILLLITNLNPVYIQKRERKARYSNTYKDVFIDGSFSANYILKEIKKQL